MTLLELRSLGFLDNKYFKDYVIHLSGNVKDDLNFINSIITL